MVASVLAWIGFATAIIAASVLCILQAVDGIALKRAVDSWAAAPPEEKTAAFRIAEGIRWTEVGTNSIFRILEGTVAIIFGVAITESYSSWQMDWGNRDICRRCYDCCWCRSCLYGVWVQHGWVGRKFHDNLFHLDSYFRCFYVEKDDVKEGIVVR